MSFFFDKSLSILSKFARYKKPPNILKKYPLYLLLLLNLFAFESLKSQEGMAFGVKYFGALGTPAFNQPQQTAAAFTQNATVFIEHRLHTFFSVVMGGSYIQRNFEIGNAQKATFEMNYLALEALGKLRMHHDNITWTIFAGPQIGYAIQTKINKNELFAPQHLHKNFYSLIAGTGVHYRIKAFEVFSELQMNLGLSDITRKQETLSFGYNHFGLTLGLLYYVP